MHGVWGATEERNAKASGSEFLATVLEMTDEVPDHLSFLRDLFTHASVIFTFKILVGECRVLFVQCGPNGSSADPMTP